MLPTRKKCSPYSQRRARLSLSLADTQLLAAEAHLRETEFEVEILAARRALQQLHERLAEESDGG